MPPAVEPAAAAVKAGTAGPAAAHRDHVIAFEARALGSALRLHVRAAEATAPASAAAEAAWATVLGEFDAVDLALSRFRSDSELTSLNRLAGSGALVPVSRRLRIALAAVDRAGRMTGGRFDASVLGALERIGEHGAPLPPEPVPGSRVDDRRCLVRAPQAPLDMGGIGKGLALRWAAAKAVALLPDGDGLLLEAGGDLVHAGIAPADGWLVGIEDPVSAPDPGDTARAPDPIAVVAVRDGAVATSSVRVRRWRGPGGRPVHHLVDPRTGDPARTGLIAVTVAGADPAWAEVWTKALFLAGRAVIADEARARGLAAWWVDDRGALGMTPEARLRCAWVAEERLGG